MLERCTANSGQTDICGRRATQVPEGAIRLPAGGGAKVRLKTFWKAHKSLDEQGARIAISNKGRILFVELSEVLSVVAQGNYVLLQREDGSCRLRGPISALAEKLEPYGLVRIHRSVMVNRRWVEEIRPSRTGEHVLRLKGGKEFTVTRSYKKNLGDLAELWLGSDTFLRGAATH